MFGDYFKKEDYKMLKIYLLGLIVMMGVLFANFGKHPVDEGLNTVRSGGHIKGVIFEDSRTISKSTIALKDEKEDISIFFKEVSQVPLQYIIIRDKKEIYTSPAKEPSNPRESRSLEFIIKKSLLQIGDSVIIINRMGDELKEISVVE